MKRILDLTWVHELEPRSDDGPIGTSEFVAIGLGAGCTTATIAERLAAARTGATVEDVAAEQSTDAIAAAAAAAAGFRGREGDRFLFTRPYPGRLQTVLLIGAGDGLESSADILKVSEAAAAAALERGAQSLLLDLRDCLALPASADGARRVGSLVARGLELATYRYDRYVKRVTTRRLERAVIVGGDGRPEPAAGLARGQLVAEVVGVARDLVNGPAELVTPRFLADHALGLARRLRHAGVQCTVLDRDACEAAGMGCFTAVARGSVHPPAFIHLAYTPATARGRVCLVGKGVTFDSGGLSLKSSPGMHEMKMDMAGAAAVLAAFEGAVRLGLEWELHAIVAAAENMVGPHAYRPGDVLTAANGATVEVVNTDAEGRLTLADALVYAGRLQPDFTVDLATLTGACVTALGHGTAGVMTTSDPLAHAWLSASERAGESMWRLPLPPALRRQLGSDIAELRNTGNAAGGALTAALFLSRFAPSGPWLHVDFAGPAARRDPHTGNAKGASGFGVATILEWLERTPRTSAR